jgi:FKBP-type peptidyl-prolyl cis-trans isomerase
MKHYLAFAVGLLLIQSCRSDDGPTTVCVPETIAQQETVINEYIDQNGLTMQTTASGLRYSIDMPGAGDNAMYGDVIEIDYRGTLLSGAQFDAGTIGPPQFPSLVQGSFIPGFEEALLLLNEGAQATIIIPSELGYACFPPPGGIIGENEILVFEMTMVSISP